MQRSIPRPFRGAALALLLTALILTTAPAAVQAQQPLPDAREIVARYVAAVGGREALTSRAGVKAQGVFELPAMGLRGDLEASHAKSGQMLMKITVPGLGEIVSGYDGEVAWAINPMTGPRVLDGEELKHVRDDADFLASLREPPSVTSIETVETSEMGGEACYRVKVKWASGRETYDCYSVASGLLVGTQISQVSPMGTLDISTTLSEYKEFDGVRMATVATQSAAGQSQVLRFTSIEFGALSDETFAPPAEVAEIIARHKEGKHNH